MAKFRFTADFDYKPSAQVTIAFKKGFEGDIVTGAAISGRVTKAVADAAIKAGKGEVLGKASLSNG